MRNFFDGMGAEAAQTSGEPEPAGLLSRIMGGVKSLVGSDAFKAATPAIVAAVQDKLSKAKSPVAKAAAKLPTLPSGLPAPVAPAKGLPKWVLPVAIGGVAIAGLVGFLALRKR
jgi:hypothetical protein